MCFKRLFGQNGSVKKEYSENYKMENTQRGCYREGYQNNQIKRDELIKLIKQQIYQDEFIKWIKKQIDHICCESLEKIYDKIEQEFDKHNVRIRNLEKEIDGHKCCIEKLEKEIETLKEAIKEKNGHSLLPNPGSPSIQVNPSNSDIKVSAAESKAEKELRCEKPKDNCELFNEQINSEVTSPQFKNIRLSFNGYKNMIEDSEGVGLYIAAGIGDYTFELYPNQKIKDLRFREKLKYAFDFETQNANHTSKIVVKKPCILREYMSGYSIESKGLVDIL